MKYSLRQLEVFLATARAETLSHAAQELAMSQSAASDALAGLEQQFDVRLFDRIGKRLQLNETGRSLLPAVEELLVRARELERVLGRKDTAGSLAVGATLSIGNYLAVPIMLRYMHENPGARVTLDVANTATIGQKIARFELDVGLIEGEIRHPDLELAPWRDDELVVFCAPQHPLAKRRRLGERELLAAHVDPARAGLRHASGLRPRHARPAGAARRAAGTAAHRGHQARRRERHRHRLPVARDDAGGLPARQPGAACRAGRDFTRQFYIVLHRRKYRSAGIRRWVELCRAIT
jgi:DNA-binding transcriptional LysR family regulator